MIRLFSLLRFRKNLTNYYVDCAYSQVIQSAEFTCFCFFSFSKLKFTCLLILGDLDVDEL